MGGRGWSGQRVALIGLSLLLWRCDAAAICSPTTALIAKYSPSRGDTLLVNKTDNPCPPIYFPQPELLGAWSRQGRINGKVSFLNAAQNRVLFWRSSAWIIASSASSSGTVYAQLTSQDFVRPLTAATAYKPWSVLVNNRMTTSSGLEFYIQCEQGICAPSTETLSPQTCRDVHRECLPSGGCGVCLEVSLPWPFTLC